MKNNFRIKYQFKDSIKDFLRIREDNLVLDFHHEKGSLLLQVYHGRDVLKWKSSVSEIASIENVLILLHFHKSKPNDKHNRLRFFESELKSNFNEINLKGASDQYWATLTNVSLESLSQFLEQVFNEVYGYNGVEPVYPSLNAW